MLARLTHLTISMYLSLVVLAVGHNTLSGTLPSELGWLDSLGM